MLALAPFDDEPVTAEDAVAIQAGVDSLDRNGGVPLEDVLADLGLSADGFHKLVGHLVSEDAAHGVAPEGASTL